MILIDHSVFFSLKDMIFILYHHVDLFFFSLHLTESDFVLLACLPTLFIPSSCLSALESCLYPVKPTLFGLLSVPHAHIKPNMYYVCIGNVALCRSPRHVDAT